MSILSSSNDPDLTVREFTRSEVDICFQLFSNEKIGIFVHCCSSHEKARSFLQKTIAAYERGDKLGVYYAVYWGTKKEIVGFCGAMLFDTYVDIQMGFLPAYRRRRFGTKLAQLLIDWVRVQAPEVCIAARIDVDNNESRLFAESLGFVYETSVISISDNYDIYVLTDDTK